MGFSAAIDKKYWLRQSMWHMQLSHCPAAIRQHPSACGRGYGPPCIVKYEGQHYSFVPSLASDSAAQVAALLPSGSLPRVGLGRLGGDDLAVPATAAHLHQAQGMSCLPICNAMKNNSALLGDRLSCRSQLQRAVPCICSVHASGNWGQSLIIRALQSSQLS